jgi:hypothetical protein
MKKSKMCEIYTLKGEKRNAYILLGKLEGKRMLDMFGS